MCHNLINICIILLKYLIDFEKNDKSRDFTYFCIVSISKY